MTVLEAITDLRDMFGPVRNQGQRPTCMAFAASDTHAALREGWQPLSCEYIFFKAQTRSGRPANVGALLPAMLAALHDDGQPDEAGWPYMTDTSPNHESWTPPENIGLLYRRDGSAEKHALDHIIAQLDQGVPVIILIKLSASFYQPGSGGIIDPTADELPDNNIRHAVIAVGHGHFNAQRAVLVRNSWGQTWGDEGYGWLTEKFILPGIFGAATLRENIDVSTSSVAA